MSTDNAVQTRLAQRRSRVQLSQRGAEGEGAREQARSDALDADAVAEAQPDGRRLETACRNKRTLARARARAHVCR